MSVKDFLRFSICNFSFTLEISDVSHFILLSVYLLLCSQSFLISRLFSAYYVVHLYQYLKEWRKTPHASLSCCLDLILPLVDLQGELSSVSGTDALDAQLDTGNIDMSTIADAVKNSEAMGGNIKDENPVLNVSMVGGVFKDREQGEGNAVEEQGGISHLAGLNKKKRHKGTQTELLKESSISDVSDQRPVEEAHL